MLTRDSDTGTTIITVELYYVLAGLFFRTPPNTKCEVVNIQYSVHTIETPPIWSTKNATSLL